MKLIFMGTPDFSVGTLEALIAAGHEITLVVSQPDKPKGRGHELAPTPVKETALKHGLKVFQPKRLKDPETIRTLEETPADAVVVIAFGQIVPASILHMKKYGCINVHGSLLPKYRGAAPIQWAVIDGERERHRRGKGKRRDDHADGRGPGYGRYAAEGLCGSGREGDQRQPLQ